MKMKLSDFLGVLTIGTIIFGLVFLIYSFIGVSIFSFLGIKFTSVKALFIFMLIFCICSTIIELFTDSFVKVVAMLRNLTKKSTSILKVFVCIPTKVIIILVIDIIYQNVEINFLAALLGAAFIFLFEYKIEENLNKQNKNSNKIRSSSEKAIDEMENALNKFEKKHKKDDNNKSNKEK
ncbi:MAG: YrvL family regulatory protein [Sarcina sp.]